MRAFTFAAIDLPASGRRCRALRLLTTHLLPARSCNFVEARADRADARLAPRIVHHLIVTLRFWYAEPRDPCGNYNARYSIFCHDKGF
jgi:hypothetical protein